MTIIRAKGNRMAEERFKKGLTIRELGSMCNVNYSTISKIENKKQCPRPRLAKAICESLGQDFNELFEFVDKK